MRLSLGLVTAPWFLMCGPAWATTNALPVHADRCAIAFALTGNPLAGCPAPDMGARPTRSLGDGAGGYYVNFGLNSDDLTPAARKHLTRLSGLLSSQLSHLCVKLVGHTDATGTDRYNLMLSKKRAQSVRLFMAGPGQLPVARLAADGLGERALLPGLKSDNAKHRRVEILAKPETNGRCD